MKSLKLSYFTFFLNVLVVQLWLTLCDPMDCSLPDSSVRGILQARILGWVALPSPEDLPDLGIKPGSPALQADSSPTEPQGRPITYWMDYHSIIGLKKS